MGGWGGGGGRMEVHGWLVCSNRIDGGGDENAWMVSVYIYKMGGGGGGCMDS